MARTPGCATTSALSRTRLVLARPAPSPRKGTVAGQPVQDGGQALAQHPGPDPAEQPGHEKPADAGEAGVLVGEASAAAMGLEPVGDVGHVAPAVAVGPRVAQP